MPLLATLSLLPAMTAALTVSKCVEPDGTVSYRDRCPPGAEKQGDYRIIGVKSEHEPTIAEIAAANPIKLYTVPQCDACDLVRNLLAARAFPFEETDVQDNADAQEELKAVSGGLTVPAVTIGERVLTGYSRDALTGALEQAGYPSEAE